MSAPAPTRQDSAQHDDRRDLTAERAKWRRKHHATIESAINLLISRIALNTGVEMPPKCRLLLSAILGAHGGGEVVGEETTRSYLALADQLQFTGSEDARRSRVRAWINAFEDWQRQTYLLVAVLKGGEVLGYDGDRPVFSASKFIDLVRPVADEMVQRARASARWRVNPGLALADQAEWGVGQLSRHADYVEPAAAAAEEAEATEIEEPTAEELVNARLKKLREYVEGREARMLKDVERVSDKFCEGELLDDAEVDARLAAIDVHQAKIRGESDRMLKSARQHLSKMRRSRLPRVMQDVQRHAAEVEDGDAPAPPPEAQAGHNVVTPHNGYYIQRKVSDLPEGFVEEVIGEAGGKENLTPPPDETCESIDESAPGLCECALETADRGVPVFPVWGVADGICDCPKGSGCGRNMGKHPHGRFAPHGVYSATTDPRDDQGMVQGRSAQQLRRGDGRRVRRDLRGR